MKNTDRYKSVDTLKHSSDVLNCILFTHSYKQFKVAYSLFLSFHFLFEKIKFLFSIKDVFFIATDNSDLIYQIQHCL